MKKIALLFAGQGSQYVGMGKELYENNDIARKVFDKANEILDIDIKKLCFEGPLEELSKTENTQPCMLTVSTAISEVLSSNNITAQYCGGLSLGEYSALINAGIISFEDGLRVIQRRGRLMQQAVPVGVGAMAAVLGLSNDILSKYCLDNKHNGIIEVANYNCPGQTVITGEAKAISKAAIELRELGAIKVIPLNVSGPFHSSYLFDAGEKLEIELRKIKFLEPKKMVISNYDNEYYLSDTNNIIYKLKKQISSSVRWEDNIRKFIEDGVDTFIEIGPGKALAGFMKKIDKSKTVYSIEDIKSIEKMVSEMSNI